MMSWAAGVPRARYFEKKKGVPNMNRLVQDYEIDAEEGESQE